MQQIPEQKPRSPRQCQEDTEVRPRGAGRIHCRFRQRPSYDFRHPDQVHPGERGRYGHGRRLIASPRTQLYERLKREHRLLKETSGNNTDFATNFIPRMDYDLLINGYKKVLSTLYSPRHYYERVRTFLREYIPPRKRRRLSISSELFRRILQVNYRSRDHWERDDSIIGGCCSGLRSAVPAFFLRPLPSRSTGFISARSLRNTF